VFILSTIREVKFSFKHLFLMNASATEVKKTVTGSGKADKDDIAKKK
jgi:Holliday junction resolvasome RuvABC endonuclease subunit